MGDVVRIFGAQTDPSERGPPKRVSHIVENIGEHVAATKKRAAWRFTLGESDNVHEVVLLHSIMTTKKVVEYDGRQQYLSTTMSPGDWTLVLILEGMNTVLEVRINEVETPDIPKYDLRIDRMSFRKLDVYRKTYKKPVQNSYSNPSSQPKAGFHQSHWGPQGSTHETNPPPHPSSSSQYNGPSSNEMRRTSSKLNNTSNNEVRHGKSMSNSAPVNAIRKPEINLIDTSVPELTVPVNTIVFDPLVTGVNLPSAPQKITGQQAQTSVDLADIFNSVNPSQPQMVGNTQLMTQNMNNANTARAMPNQFTTVPNNLIVTNPSRSNYPGVQLNPNYGSPINTPPYNPVNTQNVSAFSFMQNQFNNGSGMNAQGNNMYQQPGAPQQYAPVQQNNTYNMPQNYQTTQRQNMNSNPPQSV